METQNNFTQLCVWPAVLCGSDENSIQEFVDYMKKSFGVRVKYECEVETLPDLDNHGNAIAETGGRNDLFFYVHTDDIGKFAVPRLQAGIRWWEDVISYNNNSNHLYTEEFKEKYQPTW